MRSSAWPGCCRPAHPPRSDPTPGPQDVADGDQGRSVQADLVQDHSLKYRPAAVRERYRLAAEGSTSGPVPSRAVRRYKSTGRLADPYILLVAGLHRFVARPEASPCGL